MNVHETRVTLGAAMLAAFAGILSLDYAFDSDLGLGCLGIVAGSIGLWEFYDIAGKKGVSPLRVAGLLGGILVFLACWLEARRGMGFSFDPALLFLIILLLFLQQGLTRELEGAIKNVSVTFFGILYVSFLLAFAMAIRHLPGGKGLVAVLAILLMAKGADIGGYFIGRSFGKHRLSPSISPNKTIEGALGGLLFSTAIAVAWSLSPKLGILPLTWAIPFGLLIGTASITGDLAESIIKRDAGVKDSGGLIPAFGGMLDIIDCTLTSLPVGYYLLVLYQWKS